MRKPRVHLALYGNIGLQRGYCERCESTALIVGGDFQCCGSPCIDEPKRVKRISEPEYKRRKPKPEEQRLILIEQDYRCFWCERGFNEFAHRYGKLVKINLCWDHVSPYIWSADNRLGNFVASCQWCNGWKSDRVFQTIEEVKIHVADKWREAASPRKVRELSPAYGTKAPLAEILLEEVPMGTLGEEAPPYKVSS